MVERLLITDIVVQFSDLGIANAVADVDFLSVGNVICFNDFGQQLMQILVRNQYHLAPGILLNRFRTNVAYIIVELPCESDPIDAALSIVRCIFLLKLYFN